MAREGISKAQVFNAADTISASGQAPTVANVRAHLGSGSYTTITAYLRDWKEQANTEEEDGIDVPEIVTTALGRAAEIVWKAAQDHFAHELAAVKKSAERAIANAQEQTAEAIAEIERLETVSSQQESQIQNLSEQLTASSQASEKEERELIELRAALKAAESRIKEQGDLLKRLVPEKKTAPARAKKTSEAKTPNTPSTTTTE